MRRVRLVRGGAILAAVVLLSGCAWIARVDVPRVGPGTEPTVRSRNFFTSHTGRYVVFDSWAIDLVESTANEDPGFWGGGVFLRDNVEKKTTLLLAHASLGPDPVVSKSVRYILIRRATGPWVVLDRTTGALGPVAFHADGTPRDTLARAATISTSGRYVALREYQDNVITTSVTDLQNHTTKVLTTITPTPANIYWESFSDALSLSHNGSVLAQGTCVSSELRVTPNCRSWSLQIWDVTTGTLQSSRPDQIWPFSARLDGSGRYLAYGDGTHVHVLDRSNNATELVDLGFDGQPASGSTPSISADGRYVAFGSTAANLEPHTGSNPLRRNHIYVRDLLRNTTVLADVSLIGPSPGSGWSDWAAISGDGRYVAFASSSTYLTDDATTPYTYRLFVKAVFFPDITSVTPASGAAGTTQRVTVVGRGFRPDITVLVRNPTTVLTVTNLAVTETTLQFDVTSPAGAPTGPYDLYVYNPGGGPGSDTGAADSCAHCFHVTP